MREPIDVENWHPLARVFKTLARPRTRRNFMWFFLTGLVVTSLLGLVVTPKKYAPWDFFASWSLWGFLSYVTVVLMSWPMFRLTARRVNFYGDDEWTGGYEAPTRLAPSVPPEDHGDEIHTAPPLRTEPEADPYAVMPVEPLANAIEDRMVRPLRKRARLQQDRTGPSADGTPGRGGSGGETDI